MDSSGTPHMRDMMSENGGRRVFRIVQAQDQLEGGGFRVQRSFPSQELGRYDPFLLLDEMGPAEYGPKEAVGAPDHPHRGFETVTYMLDGVLEHKDSHGNRGVLGPGWVQWMTAGAGVVHSEMPERSFYEKGGRMHGLQLWVNLPVAKKMTTPRYQDRKPEDIPVAELPGGGTVKVIAGRTNGVDAVIETYTPMLYYHARLPPDAKATVDVPADHRTFLYVLDGAVHVHEVRVDDAHAAFLTDDADTVTLRNDGDEAASVLIIGGVPLNEPVFQWGPFVMTNPQEIQEAVQDFQAGRFGQIPAEIQ